MTSSEYDQEAVLKEIIEAARRDVAEKGLHAPPRRIRFPEPEPLMPFTGYKLRKSHIEQWLNRISRGTFSACLDNCARSYAVKGVGSVAYLTVYFPAAPEGLKLPLKELAHGKCGVQRCFDYDLACEPSPVWGYDVPWQGMKYTDESGFDVPARLPVNAMPADRFLFIARKRHDSLYRAQIGIAQYNANFEYNGRICFDDGLEFDDVEDFLAWIPVNSPEEAGPIQWKTGKPPKYVDPVLVCSDSRVALLKASQTRWHQELKKIEYWADLPSLYGRLSDEVDSSSEKWRKSDWSLKDQDVQKWLDRISKHNFSYSLNACCYLRGFVGDCVRVEFEAAPEGLLIPKSEITHRILAKNDLEDLP